MTSPLLDNRSRDLRLKIIETMMAGGRGHLGAAFSLVEILRVLYDDILRYDPKKTDWPDRDRLILSKGHGCLALYVLLAEKGFFATDELKKFCAFDGLLGGHPETKIPGIETSTGALGHGPAVGLGMALAARLDRRNYRVMVVTGDGECNEGSVWEAAMIAAKQKLDNFTIIIDYNKRQSYGPTNEVQELEPFADKWRAFGFAVREVDGHDVDAMRESLSALPFQRTKPSALICHTVKGKGSPVTENNDSWHHKSGLKDFEIAPVIDALRGGSDIA